MPAWYTKSYWIRGQLASEDDGTMVQAAVAEQYLLGRNDFAAGIKPWSPARSFADAAQDAIERAHADAAGSSAAFRAMPVSVQVAKFWEYLAGCTWPSMLDLWRGGSDNLLSDAYDLFTHVECRGAGAAAERILLGNALRMRAVLKQLHPLNGVLEGSPDTSFVVAALRGLCSSVHMGTMAPTYVTLNDLLAVNQALNKALPHCDGPTFAAKSLGERVAKAKELCERDRSLSHYSFHGGLLPTAGSFGDASSSAGASSSKVAGKYDRVRLESAKNSEEYNVAKAQILTAFSAGNIEKATLVCLRGADSPVAASPAAPAARLPPHKVLSDLLLGNKGVHLEVWNVDKELDAAMAVMRRGLPAHWGRRVAKHLQLNMDKAVPLPELASLMSNPAGWADKPPDFYNCALLKARVADGDLPDDVHASFGYTPGADPWANAQIAANLAVLVSGLLSDIGVSPDPTVVDFTTVQPGDLYSTMDMFGFLAYVHARLGGLSTTAGKLSELACGLLKDFGINRGSACASSDATRALGARFVEQASVRIQEFLRYKDEQLRGREIHSQLRAAGWSMPTRMLSFAGPAQDVASVAAAAAGDKRDRAGGDFAAEVQKEVRKQLKALASSADATKGARGGGGVVPVGGDEPELPPVKIVLLDDGKRVHISGGRRGPSGCWYLLAGPGGIAHRLKALNPSVGPVWFVATRAGIADGDLAAICAKSKWPGDNKVPDDEPDGIGDVKLSDYRINEDGTQFTARNGKGAGAGGGPQGRGKGGRGRGRGGGGRGSVALVAANLAGGTTLAVVGAPRADVVTSDAPALGSAPLGASSALVPAAAVAGAGSVGRKYQKIADELRGLEEAAARQHARSKAGLPLCDGPDMVAASHEASRGPGLRKQLVALTADELRELEEAAARQRARSAAGLPLCDGPDMVAASHEASRGPGLRRQLVALTAGRDFSAPGSARGADGFVNYLQRARCSPAVTFAPGTPPTGGGTALGARGVWASHVGGSPARRGLQEPPIFRFDGNDVPPRATLIVTVRTDAAAGLVLKPPGNALFGMTFEDEPTRDAAVASSRLLVATLLGEAADVAVYLAGEWVDGDYRWRVVLCVAGGPLRTDMAAALRDGAAPCGTCHSAQWLRSSYLAGTCAGDIALAALARARVALRPSTALDARLRIGRGDQRWVDTSQDAATDARPLLGESVRMFDPALLGTASPSVSHRVEDVRSHISERMEQAQAEVQQLLRDEAVARRAQGDAPLADFLEGCASRVEPAPLSEVPTGLQAPAFAAEDIDELTVRPFKRNTLVTETAAPVYKARPTEFPAHLPSPTSHASFLQSEVMEECYTWYERADHWHRQRLAGLDSTRPKGVAYGFDAFREEWRPFFEAGGVVLFDEHTGRPECLTKENYPLRPSLNGEFAEREFADYPDQEAVAAMRDGVCIKAQGLPALQLACNLEALYTADGVAGVRCVAAELDKFSSYDGSGWLLMAPQVDRQRGLLSTATLPSCASPIGAVPKKDGGTRVVTDMTYPYGKLALRTLKNSPLPPDHLWDGTSPYRPAAPRPLESAITLGGGGATALPPNVASGPSKPPKGESYVPGGPHPWPREGKCTVAEQVENDAILWVPCQLAGLPQYHLMWDFWKCFHQSHYHAFEVIATAALVPHLDGEGNMADHLRGQTNARMAMGGLFASGICQRNGNGIYCKVMRRFDARQRARRLVEPESPAVAAWLAAREALPHDDYGTQARLAAGGFYSDDPKISVVGPPSRALDLALSFYEVVGPQGLAFKLAEHTKWLVACWASWQGVRMSAMLGLLWLPPDKALRANEDLREYGAGRMVGADFVKMMGYLNYLSEVLVVHANLNRLLWQSYDEQKLVGHAPDIGVTAILPGPPQRRAVASWRKIIMCTPGTTLLRVVRRAPPPTDNVTVWSLASDACMDVVTVAGVKVAGCLQGGVDYQGKPMHDPPGMGGVLYGRLWQLAFTAAEIEVVTIPVAEFMAAVVGLIVYDHVGALDFAGRVCLEVDAEATPRTALQGEAHRPGLLIAHDEFLRLPVYGKYKSRLTSQHVFGAGNEGADKASRSQNAAAERLVRFLGLEPKWLAVPPEALDYVSTVVSRLRDLQQGKKTPGTCDPAEPGGDAPRFGSTSSPPIAPRSLLAHSPPAAPPAAPARAPSSPALLVAKRRAGSPYSVPDDASAPRAPPVVAPRSPPVVRALPLPLSPSAASGHLAGRAPTTAARGAADTSRSLSVVSNAAALADAEGGDEQRVSFVVTQRVDALLATNQQNSARPHAFRGDPAHLRALLDCSLRTQARSANENSLAAEETHKRLYWAPYCEMQRTSVVRPDVRGLTWDEVQLEEAWWAGAIPFVQGRMPNQQGVVGAALPHSVLKVVQNIRRAHMRMNIQTVSLAPCVRATEGLLKEFILEHGPLALIPKRKEPLTNEEIASIFAYSGPIGKARALRRLNWDSSEYSSLLAMFHTLAQTGMRKGEVSLAKNARFDKSRIAMLNVRWSIGGVVYDELTPALYARLCAEGGYALLRPPPSKADPFSLHWGPCTIYLRFHPTETINAARELAREELRRAVPLAERELAPLFVKADGSAWRHAELAKTFDDIVVAVCGADRAKQVSMHSWRVYLACALLAKGASFATIQTMLRWRSEDALRIYARINNFAYADWLSSAQGASVSSIRTTTGVVGQLSAPPEPGTLAGTLRDAAAMQEAEAAAMQGTAAQGSVGTPLAGFQHEWMRRAAQAVDAAVRDAHAQEAQPEVDAYARVSSLSNSMTSLILAAERADAEEPPL